MKKGRIPPVKPSRGHAMTVPGQYDHLKRCITSAIDYFVIPLCIVFLLFDPNFLHGFIDHLEAGQYLSSVQAIFEGKVPYKDFFILFGPLQIYSIAFVMVLFGKMLATLRAFFYFNYMISFIGIYFLARNVCKNRIFVCLVTFMSLVEVSQPFWATRWDFGRMGLGILILLLLIQFVRKENPKLLIAAGFVSGLTLLYTLDIGIIGIASSIFLLGALAFTRNQRTSKTILSDILKSAIPYAAGILCGIIPISFFLALKGALLPYLNTAFYIIPKYHIKMWGHPPAYLATLYGSGQGLSFFLGEVCKAYLPMFIYGPIFLYLLYSLARKQWNKESAIIALLFVYGVLTYKASFRAIEGTQFQVALPPLLILIGLFLEKMFNFLRARKGEPLQAVLAAGLVIITLFYFTASHKRYYESLSGWMRYQNLKSRLVGMYMFPMPVNKADLVDADLERLGKIRIPRWQAYQMKEVTDYLKANTSVGEGIFTFPEHGLYNFLSDRPFIGKFAIAGFAWTSPQWRQELLSDLRANKPNIILYCTTLSNMAQSIGRSEELLPDVVSFIKDNYSAVADFGDISVYKPNR